MLRSELDGPVLRLTLDRPEVRNAFNDGLIAQLTDAFRGAASQARVVVVAGEGKSFSAGGDLDWMRRAAGYTEDQNYEDAMRLGALFEAIVACPACVVARVHGAAFGGGAGLVACADVAVAAEGTMFAFSEARLGLVPATISPFVLPKVGAGNARWLFTTAEAFDAETALRIGLVHQVAAPGALDEAVEAKVQAVLGNGPAAVASAKRVAVDGPFSMPVSARLLSRARASDEGKEGVAAFLEKRRASFDARTAR
jgi:enoyl-CoA hydratase/carnithine racemase